MELGHLLCIVMYCYVLLCIVMCCYVLFCIVGIPVTHADDRCKSYQNMLVNFTT